MTLPAAFLTRPIAHRALHDRAAGRIENSVAAITAAVAAGYGIEIDVQLSSDGLPVVFHDDRLDRLTDRTGALREHSLAALAQIALKDSDGTIPSLRDVLQIVAGQVPLLIEIKDQDGAMGPAVGVLERATCDALAGYRGDVALMSFNPHSMAACMAYAPHLPRGLVTSAYAPQFWPEIPASTRDHLREIPDFDRVGACFISHEATDLARPRVAAIKRTGAPVLCWTIRSAAAAAKACEIADNITFEGYLA